jgi:hypothetical protein
LVDKANDLGLIPRQFRNNTRFFANLANYIFDSSLPTGYGEKLKAYNKVIQYLGKEIYSNRYSILRGSYNRRSTSLQILRPEWNLDQPSKVKPIYILHYGKDRLIELLKKYNNASEGCIDCATVKPTR